MKVNLKKTINKMDILGVVECYKEDPKFVVYSNMFDEMLDEVDEHIKVTGYFIEDEKNQYLNQASKKGIYCIVTLGDWVDKKVNAYFKDYDYLKGMMLNALADSILFEGSNQLYGIITNQIEKENLYLSARYEPGTNKVPVQYQEDILKIVNKEYQTEIDLTSGYMLNPIKSLAYFYGVGKEQCSNRIDHDCSVCNMVNCQYKKIK